MLMRAASTLKSALVSPQEEEWKRLLSDLSSDLEGKLDRLEFSRVKQELEKQLKALAKQIKNLGPLGSAEDDAAGFRK